MNLFFIVADIQNLFEHERYHHKRVMLYMLSRWKIRPTNTLLSGSLTPIFHQEMLDV